MKKIFLIVCTACLALSVSAQPAARRNQQQRQSPANTITTRAQISFPTTAPMEEDVVWRQEMIKVRNLGRKSLEEVKIKLQDLELGFREE